MTGYFKARLHVPSPCPCPSLSPSVNGEGPLDRQIGFGAHSACQCKFDGDGEWTGVGTVRVNRPLHVNLFVLVTPCNWDPVWLVSTLRLATSFETQRFSQKHQFSQYIQHFA